APHAAVRDLDAATVADDALVLDALVLAAEALPVPLGTEDALAEETVLLRAVRAVVDGLRLLDLAVAPRPDVGRGGEADLHRGVVVDPAVQALDHLGSFDGNSGVLRTGNGRSQMPPFSSSMLSASPLISLQRTSKLTGVPASRMFSPLTM